MNNNDLTNTIETLQENIVSIGTTNTEIFDTIIDCELIFKKKDSLTLLTSLFSQIDKIQILINELNRLKNELTNNTHDIGKILSAIDLEEFDEQTQLKIKSTLFNCVKFLYNRQD